MKLFANLLSYLFHPIFAPLYGVFIAFQLPIYQNFRLNEKYKVFVYAILLLNLVVMPVLLSLYLQRKKLISSLKMPTVEERKIPYFISCVFFLLTYFLLVKVNFPNAYLHFFKGATIAVFILYIFSILKHKISAHLTALGGICGMLFIFGSNFQVNTINFLIVAILTSGLVASARVILKQHSLLQLLLGFLLGFGSQFLADMF